MRDSHVVDKDGVNIVCEWFGNQESVCDAPDLRCGGFIMLFRRPTMEKNSVSEKNIQG